MTKTEPPPELKEYTVAVHALKGICASIGADGLASEAALLEEAGRAGDRDAIREKLPAFCEKAAALRDAACRTLESAGRPVPGPGGAP
jgi:HPt (histidine-containing phosphotransfer) domain-containing protein